MQSRGTLGLMPRTRRGLVFFWTALFMLSIALQYAAAMAPKSALALSGAIYTSNIDGSIINANIYGSKADVYLTGGPCQSGSHLGADTYYFEVTSPNGVLLSSDAIGNRQFSVGANGFISGTTGTHVTHDVSCTPEVGVTLQLLPYDDTPNPGGEYKLTIGTAASVEECSGFDAESEDFEICNQADSKSDNFKVGPNGDLKVVKTIEGGPAGASGSFPVSADCGNDGTFTGSIAFPSPGFITFHDIAAGASCTVTEGALPNPPAGYTYGTPTYTNNPATIGDGTTVTVGVVNHLNLIPAPAISIVKSVALAADGPWENELTVAVGTTVFYRITISNEGNVPLTGVTLKDSIYDPIADFCDDPIPTSLAVGADFDCNYSVVVDESGTIHNVATVDSGQTDPEDDDATVNGTEDPVLSIQKSNNAPLDAQDLPTASEGDTVTFTLEYSISNGPATGGVIVDFLPDGLSYVEGSATDSANGEFVFEGYDPDTHTLAWTAEEVTEGGSVTYQATVDDGAAALEQPLENTGCIASDASQEEWDDCDASDVFVAPPPQAETSVPTPPQTDIATTESSASTGSLLLVLLALAGIALAVVFVAPTPASIRRRMDR
jgi:uncharacterized repeat protein (TIGR01451 family)